MNGRGLGALAAMAAVGAAVAGGVIYAHRVRQPAETPPPVELPAPEPEPAPEPVPTPAPPPPDRAPEIIATLVELCRYLKSGPVTDKQVVRHLGTIIEEYGSGFVIQPKSPLFSSGLVGHPWDDEEDGKDTMPSSIDFDLADPTQLTVAQLVAAFGPYDLMIRHHPEAPQGIGFGWSSQPPGPIDCTIFAYTRGSPQGREDRAPVLNVTLRPDPHQDER